MPAVPLVQINEFAGFLQDLFFAGVEIALEKILLKEVFLFDLAAFFFSSFADLALCALQHFVEIIRIYRFEDVFGHTVADRLLRKGEVAEAAEYDDLEVGIFFFGFL